MSNEGNLFRLDGNQYRIIVESAPNMIWRAGLDALCNYFNTTWLTYTGRTMEQEAGNGWAEGVHRDDFDRCLRIYLGAFDKRESFEMVYRLKRNDGEYRWIHDRGVPFYDDTGEFGGYIGSCIDINEQIVGESWKSIAQKDGLTGLWNRHFFDQEARRITDAAGCSGLRLSAVMFDIDRFKEVNDSYGHQFGDRVLIAFSGILKASIRDTDLLGRYGGDEFVLLLPQTGADETENVIRRVSEKAVPNICYGEASVALSFSFGIAELRADETYESFIGRADRSMYEAKRRKKDAKTI
jgi:diguanylate cyclase (GGDEF)-like protein/PAS domain S-box-containing protein